MPGPLLTAGTPVQCAHAGTATPLVPSTRVFVNGQPAVALASPYVVAGCTQPPAPAPGPCLSAQFVVGATRVFVEAQPALLADSQAICAPTGTPLIPTGPQPRVVGM